jgi:hypothetical protein
LTSPSSLCRDRKRKRFVKETGKEADQKKKKRTESGQMINNKNKKNLYLCHLTDLY